MYHEDKQDRERRAVTRTALRCAVLARKYTSHRARFYLCIATDDPPDHPARPPCTLKNWWSMAPPHNTLPAYRAGEARAGPRPVRHFAARGGDG